jgi:ATP phosphoribosyltransferase/ATP phosphoribosyltransferase regulatory subunit
VPLGALFQESVACLAEAGVDTAPLAEAGRRLVLPGSNGTVFITTRPSDVPTYVESGAADLGIVGKDVLREQGPDVYELIDLGFGRCRMIYATPAGDDPTPGALEHLGAVRVATKYPRTAADHFAATGRQAEVVRVHGSVELAPLVGLSHGIVDLTATGRTLRETGLVEREQIFGSSARLIANRVSHKLRAEAVDDLVRRLEEVIP